MRIARQCADGFLERGGFVETGLLRRTRGGLSYAFGIVTLICFGVASSSRSQAQLKKVLGEYEKKFMCLRCGTCYEAFG